MSKVKDFSKYRFIVYARFTSNDSNYYPCLCEKVVPSNLIPETLILKNVYALQDRVYSSFEMENLYVRTENIMYVCEGSIDENKIKDLLKTDEQDLIEDEFVTKEVKDES